MMIGLLAGILGIGYSDFIKSARTDRSIRSF